MQVADHAALVEHFAKRLLGWTPQAVTSYCTRGFEILPDGGD
jgi:hypothetical protein